jgi:hypothetical protein
MDWKPTLEFRQFFRKYVDPWDDGSRVIAVDGCLTIKKGEPRHLLHPPVLQQKWVSHLGTEEWRDIVRVIDNKVTE